MARHDEETRHRKEEFRQAIDAVRRQIHDAELALSKQVVPDKGLTEKRMQLELKLRQSLGEYSTAQHRLESYRCQKLRRAADSDGVDKGAQCRDIRETKCGRLMLNIGAASWQGNKDAQEDRFMLDVDLESSDGKKIVGLCVLDGHSGTLCCDFVVEWLRRNLQKCLSAKPALTDESLKQAVTEAFVLTDDEFLHKARERQVLDGSTGLVCLLYPDDSRVSLDGTKNLGHCGMLVANLGDSRAVMCRAAASEGAHLSAVRLSDDHKPARADERRRIEAKGGVVDVHGVWRVFTPGPANFGGRSVLWGLAVSRAFGDLLMKEPHRYGCQGVTGELVSALPEIHSYQLRPNEDRFLVLACDGIWDVLNDDEAVAVCLEHRSADLAAHALVRRAFEMGSDDNLTALVVAWEVAGAHANSQVESEGDGEPEAKKAKTA